MKKILSFLVIILITVIFQSCKDSIVEPQLLYPSDNFFPNTNGSQYSYSVQVSDSLGIILAGSRSQYFSSYILLEGTTYQTEKDTFTLDRSSEINESYFRKSDSGVFYYADASGLSFTVPDSLKEYLNVDKEYRILFTPLSINQTWPVYRVEFNYKGFGFYVINSFASVISEDTLSLDLNLINQKHLSLKIKFNLELRLSPTSKPISYEAFGWTVNNIGFVKWAGDSELFNFIFNTNIFPMESNVKMDLNHYIIP